MKAAKQVLLASILILAVAGAVAAIYGPAYVNGSNHSAGRPAGKGNVLATVNGQVIAEADMLPLLQTGLDRSVALDRRITQTVLAQAAEKTYVAEAQQAIDDARNDILAQIYTTKRTVALRAEVTDKDIATFYDKNVNADQFRLLKIKGYVTTEAKDAQALYEQASGPKDAKETKDAIAKMQYLKKDGEHFLAVAQVPYNLGQVLKKMRAGDVLQPVVIREGVLVAMVEEIKEMPKPGLETVKEEVRNYLVMQKIDAEVQSLRKLAKIELKG